MQPTIPLDAIYTATEAAERLRVTRRTIIKLGRDLGACSKISDEYLFSEKDLLDIWQAQRAMPTSSQGRAVNVKAFLSDLRLQRSLVSLTQKKRRRP
ncbi:helix-turn-helix domain-containing protein [Sinorhizobium numidicum]|uniref:Helix-turn-helix domain-containing protein n=1 Tax=Sinorhizobium numidicum TaxID=680248 RepID=A0ABY8CXZ9_9HYPH|nr:helix-turn-helix domain-containing protein [Sinorhizobium numidicum]WEX76861.1 helix-turn-helix domain-containing protein [Sinorhizobium numidicum]WEX83521.1 helix-turn-helix domain-containing protein [Sinorhizobium numidicum]